MLWILNLKLDIYIFFENDIILASLISFCEYLTENSWQHEIIEVLLIKNLDWPLGEGD